MRILAPSSSPIAGKPLVPHYLEGMGDRVFGKEPGELLIVAKTGRSAVKSVGGSMGNFVSFLLKPYTDIVLSKFEVKDIASTFYKDCLEALYYMGLPTQLIMNEHLSPQGEMYFDLVYQGFYHRVLIRNGSKKDISLNGVKPMSLKESQNLREPNPQPHKIFEGRIYEGSLFINGSLPIYENNLATLTRGISIHEDFHIFVETNEVLVGAGGGWINELIDMGKKQNAIGEKNKVGRKPFLYKGPDDMGVLCLNFKDEGWQFTNEVVRSIIVRSMITDPDTLNGTYGGKQIAGNTTVFKQLKEHFNKLFDGDPVFNPNKGRIGIDLGKMDATCASLTLIEDRPGKPLRLAVGADLAGHSNRGKEIVTPINKTPIFEGKSVADQVTDTLMPAIDYGVDKYMMPIKINVEYAEGETSLAIVAALRMRYREYTHVSITSKFYKGKIQDSVDMFNGLFDAGPDYCRVPNFYIYEGLRSLNGKDMPEVDGALKIKDNTGSEHAKFFDVGDATRYCFDEAERNQIIREYAMGKIYDYESNLIKKS